MNFLIIICIAALIGFVAGQIAYQTKKPNTTLTIIGVVVTVILIGITFLLDERHMKIDDKLIDASAKSTANAVIGLVGYLLASNWVLLRNQKKDKSDETNV
jgi:hypothetical protein